MKDCHFGVSPVNYSDSDSDSQGLFELQLGFTGLQEVARFHSNCGMDL